MVRTFNGQPLSQFARNLALAVIAGTGGGLLVNTARRDSERTKRLVGYAALTGVTGASIGYIFGVIRKQPPILCALSSGSSVFAISGTFSVLRENLLVSSKAHKWRRTLDELQGKPSLTLRKEAMTGTQASGISGGISGLVLSFALGRGFSIAISTTLQGVVLGVVGQWSVYKCQQWILEERIKYHYPELVANAKACEIGWYDWAYQKLTTRTHSSLVDEKIHSLTIQLQLLQEEEERLLHLKQE